jgi:GNAT superfamily N-acetyltransferase
MHIEQVDLTVAGTEKIRECFEVYHAAQRVDEPEGPWFTERPFGGWLTVGWGGDPREVWLAVDQGSAAGWYRLDTPTRENLDQAGLELVVHPAERRRGLGLTLLRHAAGRAAAHGRTVLNGGARNGSPGEAFSRSVGAKPGLVEVQRTLDIGTLESGKLSRLRGPAERAAAGYSLQSWPGPVPEEFIEQVAVLYNAMGDAPRDPEIAHEEWDAERVRELVNELRPHYRLRDYTLVARHDDTGELAALTEIAVDPANPGWGFQMNTVVTRKHRGHRLGLLVKIAMMELLATAEPQLERITTWNAEANEHMIAINEAIGYAVWGRPNTWWRLDVAAASGSGG